MSDEAMTTTEPMATTEDSFSAEAVAKLMGQGRRHLVCSEVMQAVKCFEEATQKLDGKYGSCSTECGEAYLFYGKALLDLARTENGVLGNALEDAEALIPKEEDRYSDEYDDEMPSVGPKIKDMSKAFKQGIRGDVQDAMAEEGEDAKPQTGKEEDQTDKDNDQADTDETKDKKKDGLKEEKDKVELQETGSKCEEKDKVKPKKESKCEEKDIVEPEPQTDSKCEEKDNVKPKTRQTERKTEKKENLKPEPETECKSEGTASTDVPAQGKEGEKGVGEEGEPETVEDEDEGQEGEEQDDGESDNEGESDGEGDKGDETPEGKEDGELSTMHLAWETLELARHVFSGQDSKEGQLNLAQVYLKLGEIQLEQEQFVGAADDFQKCLDLQSKHLEPDNRLIAETTYNIGLAYCLQPNYLKAKEFFSKALEVIELRTTKLEARIAKAEGKSKGKGKACDDDPCVVDRKELEDLRDLFPEIKAKVDDAEEMIAGSQTGAAETTEGFGTSGVDMGEATVSKIPVKSSTLPVTDVSHLVRRNKAAETTEGFGSSGVDMGEAIMSKIPVKPSTSPVSDVSHLVRRNKRKPEEGSDKGEQEDSEIPVKKARQEDQPPVTQNGHTANGNTTSKEQQ